jgi:predicted O-linked N-acetylglucosamine transferase (SPINDLY family)
MTARQNPLETALAHHRAGRLDAAEAGYRQLLAQCPRQPDVLHLLAVLEDQRGRLAEAAELARAAINVNDGVASYHCTLGVVLAKQGQIQQAIEQQQKAIVLEPNYANALANLATALTDSGRLSEAVEAFQRLLTLAPGDAANWVRVAGLLRSLGRLEESVSAYRNAIKLVPHDASMHNDLGVALGKLGRMDEAVAEYRAAVVLDPTAGEPLINLGGAMKDRAELDEAIACYRRALETSGDRRAADNLLVTLNYHGGYGPEQLRAEAVQWNDRFARPIASRVSRGERKSVSGRRIRIGYVSARFHEGRFLTPLFTNHDRSSFEIFCYADLPSTGLEFPRLVQCADAWRHLRGMPDEQAAKVVRDDQIDILIDLMMHTGANRLLMFAHKPAPVQATWFGYPGTSGLETMDFRVSDPFLDPPGIDETCYVEKTLRLPHCFWCFDPCDDGPAVSDLPARANGSITFGSLNNLCKVSRGAIELWAAVMAAVPRSRFLLLAPGQSIRNRIRGEFASHGIDPNRIEFADPASRRKYLEHYHRIDLNLDTIPCPGHATSFDSLWMGVPVVTLPGNTVIFRGGSSILNNIGLTEMIARTPDEYVAFAIQLAGDLPRLARFRSTLRQRILASPLMNGPQFAREMEAAYLQMLS